MKPKAEKPIKVFTHWPYIFYEEDCLWDKITKDRTVHYTPYESEVCYRKYVDPGGKRICPLLKDRLQVEVNKVYHDCKICKYSMDLQIGRVFERLYFDCLNDRIIFWETPFRDILKNWLAKHFDKVSLVGDLQLVQVIL